MYDCFGLGFFFGFRKTKFIYFYRNDIYGRGIGMVDIMIKIMFTVPLTAIAKVAVI